MNIAAALLMIAQSAAPQAAQAPISEGAGASVSVRASARVIRSQRVEFSQDPLSHSSPDARAPEQQRTRDPAGTLWVEFS